MDCTDPSGKPLSDPAQQQDSSSNSEQQNPQSVRRRSSGSEPSTSAAATTSHAQEAAGAPQIGARTRIQPATCKANEISTLIATYTPYQLNLLHPFEHLLVIKTLELQKLKREFDTETSEVRKELIDRKYCGHLEELEAVLSEHTKPFSSKQIDETLIKIQCVATQRELGTLEKKIYTTLLHIFNLKQSAEENKQPQQPQFTAQQFAQLQLAQAALQPHSRPPYSFGGKQGDTTFKTPLPMKKRTPTKPTDPQESANLAELAALLPTQPSFTPEIMELLKNVRTPAAGHDTTITLGIIGGTGVYQLSELITEPETVEILETTFGLPSDLTAIRGRISKTEVIVISRHGKAHNINPSNVNYRANLWALKHQFKVHAVIATTACGSLRRDIPPTSIVVLDQYIDRTRHRKSSFFKVCHVPQAFPFDETLRDCLIQALTDLKFDFKPTGTAVTIEGPRFSTRAESQMFQSWGASIVNMTSFPEAPLCAELGIHYASLALVTDYDCWHEDVNEHVNVQLVSERQSILRDKVLHVIKQAVRYSEKKDWQKLHIKAIRIERISKMNPDLDN